MLRILPLSIRHALLIAAFPLAAAAQTSLPATEAANDPPSGLTEPALPPASSELSSGGVNATRSEAGLDAEAERVPSSPAERLRPVMRNDITYLCGGIGDEEAAYMKSEAPSYDLMLTFAARDGAYLADVHVDIADAAGRTVLQARCDSPLMLVDLPRAGSYRIRADAGGHVIRRSVKVNAGRKTGRHLATAVLTWPQQAAENASVSNRTSGGGASGAARGGAGMR